MNLAVQPPTPYTINANAKYDHRLVQPDIFFTIADKPECFMNVLAWLADSVHSR